MPRSTPFSPLYPILDASLQTKDALGSAVASLARAGCRLVQLRAKELSSREFLSWAELAIASAKRTGTALVVNDRADVALLAGADGVHLGQRDLSVEGARRVLGDGAIIGLSTHSVAQAREANRLTCDYVAIGPAFTTRTKAGAGEALGVRTIRDVRGVVQKPLVAIGGITMDRTRSLVEAGVDGVAVISELRAAGEDGTSLEDMARKWLKLIADR